MPVYQDSSRRAHSIAAQGGINAAKNYPNDGDTIWRLFYEIDVAAIFARVVAEIHTDGFLRTGEAHYLIGFDRECRHIHLWFAY